MLSSTSTERIAETGSTSSWRWASIFDTVLKPRILRVVYSKNWRAGRPVSRTGSSHFLKYLVLESYEDALNNLQLRERSAAQRKLLQVTSALREEYLLSYCLDVETDGSASLLDLERFASPFDYKLTVTHGAENQAVSIDLPETFNYLLGLRVRRSAASTASARSRAPIPTEPGCS